MKITGNEPINPTIWDERYKPEFQRDNDGLTIRQHFACQAMQAILSTAPTQALKFSLEDVIPKLAVRYADILIEELNKSEQ
jgi:hypothetical protein